MAILLVMPVCNWLLVLYKLAAVEGDIGELAADLIARYGGEGFALIGSCTGPTEANRVVQVICSQVRNCAIAYRAFPDSFQRCPPCRVASAHDMDVYSRSAARKIGNGSAFISL